MKSSYDCTFCWTYARDSDCSYSMSSGGSAVHVKVTDCVRVVIKATIEKNAVFIEVVVCISGLPFWCARVCFLAEDFASFLINNSDLNPLT